MKKALIILTVLCLLLCAACGPETPSESASAGTTTGATQTEQTGFASAAHFRRVFRETMGVGPLQYRKSRK